MPVVPVLAEQAIKGASLIEDCQVLVAMFSSLGIGKPRVTSSSTTRTHPVGYAVGGQGIVVPTDVAFPGGGTDKSIFRVGTQSTVAPAICGNTAFIGAKLAFKSSLKPGRLLGEVKRSSRCAVSFLNKGENLTKVPSDTIQA